MLPLNLLKGAECGGLGLHRLALDLGHGLLKRALLTQERFLLPLQLRNARVLRPAPLLHLALNLLLELPLLALRAPLPLLCLAVAPSLLLGEKLPKL